MIIILIAEMQPLQILLDQLNQKTFSIKAILFPNLIQIYKTDLIWTICRVIIVYRNKGKYTPIN